MSEYAVYRVEWKFDQDLFSYDYREAALVLAWPVLFESHRDALKKRDELQDEQEGVLPQYVVLSWMGYLGVTEPKARCQSLTERGRCVSWAGHPGEHLMPGREK